MGTILEIGVIVLLIAVNGFFALAEIAIITARKTRLRQWVNRGNRRAQVALELANHPTAFLSSVQIGITLVGILAGAFGGATLAADLALRLAGVPWLAPYARTVSFILVVAGVTYLTVIIGELAPKRIALTHPERFAVAVAVPMRLVARLTAPIVAVLGVSAEFVLRVLRVRPIPHPSISDEEIRMLLEEGITTGVFERAEKEIVDRLFRLSDRRVNGMMTPRMAIVWLDADAPEEEVIRTMLAHPFTAFPVCQGDVDHVVGLALARDIVRAVLAREPLALRTRLRQPLFMHENLQALAAIERMKRSGSPAAIIISEYGETEGVLTLTDIVESLVGEFPSPTEEPEIVRREDGSLLVDGQLPVDELKDLLRLEALPEEAEAQYRTLAGFILTLRGRLPRVGDAVTWDGYRFEVVDIDVNRIDRVLITREPAAG